MNAVYFRVALYFLAPLIGSLQGITFDGDHIVTIDLELAFVGILSAAGVVGGVFAKWGHKR